jgi:hypothetical protein
MKKLNFSSAVERIAAAPISDTLEMARNLEDRVRARVALYCYVRSHLRDKGLAIASICSLKDLSSESSFHVAENILTLAMRVAEREPAQQQSRFVNLATI